MLYGMWIVVFFGTAFLMIEYPKSKLISKLCVYALFVFLFIMHGWSRGAYDVEIGISRYNNYQSYQAFTEVGFDTLVQMGHSLGFSYRTFYVFLALFELIIIFWFVTKNCVRSPIALGLFILYPSVILLQYSRNIVAVPFILMGIVTLLNKRKHYIPRFVLLIIFATLFHASSVVFLLLLPLSFLPRKTAVMSVAGAAVFFEVASNLSFLYNLVSRYIGSSKADILSRTANAEGNFGRIVALLLAIAVFFVMYYLLKKVYKVEMDDDRDRVIFNMNTLLFICIPLTTNFAVGFARIPSLVWIVNYVFYVNKICEIQSQRKRLFCYCVLGLMLGALLFLAFRNLAYRELVLYPFFEQNEFVELLFAPFV
ncbi:EpsG family protein [Enterococcus faecium]|uniref:EpsG family protein n=1 Tax=Enterococcus faecium TaxID=1352 RepID=UPI00296B510C|nr:EpsG family protein [Enterococcus faecium]MDW3709240.1 EpsG family protein [Enterococcus faecium]